MTEEELKNKSKIIIREFLKNSVLIFENSFGSDDKAKFKLWGPWSSLEGDKYFFVQGSGIAKVKFIEADVVDGNNIKKANIQKNNGRTILDEIKKYDMITLEEAIKKSEALVSNVFYKKWSSLDDLITEAENFNQKRDELLEELQSCKNTLEKDKERLKIEFEEEYEKKQEELQKLYDEKLKNIASEKLKYDKRNDDLIEIERSYKVYLPEKQINLKSNIKSKEYSLDYIKKYLNESPSFVSEQLVLATLASLSNRRLVLLTGTVGSGKTFSINELSEKLGLKEESENEERIEENYIEIPVRPAWLDSSDLLGYYDPINETFRATKLTTFLLRKKPDVEKAPVFICFDEMNIARIENYAGDLLSILETKGKKLALYNKDNLFRLGELKSKYVGKNDNETIKYEILYEHLKAYAPEIFLPRKLVIFGTINSDHTTFDISPKVIDRSLVIAYPPYDLKSERLKEFRSIGGLFDWFENESLELKEFEVDANKLWSALFVEYSKLQNVIRPLSKRVKQDFMSIYCSGRLIGLKENKIALHFACLKILPRVYFFNDDDEKVSRLEDFIKILENLMGEIKLGNIEAIKLLKNQLKTKGIIKFFRDA